MRKLVNWLKHLFSHYKKGWTRIRLVVAIPTFIVLLVLIPNLISYNIVEVMLRNLPPEQKQINLRHILGFMNNVLCIATSLAALGGLLLAYVIIPPIKQLSRGLAQLAEDGSTEALQIDQGAGAEIALLGDSFNRIVNALSRYLPERNRYVFDHMASGVITISSEGLITSLNSTAGRILGLKVSNTIGKEIDKAFPTEGNYQPLKELLKEAIAGLIVTNQEIDIVRSDNETITLGVTTTISRESFTQGHEVLATIMDLTGIKDVHEKMLQSDRLSAVGTLAAGVAHEIRNPLSAIRGLTQILAEEMSPDDERRKDLEVMLTEIDRLNRVVEQLLDFSAANTSKHKDTNLIAVTKRALALAEHNIKRKKITVKFSSETSLPWLSLDEDKILQAILNILINAAEAVGEEGQIKISVGKSPDDSYEAINIYNNGPPIPEKILPHIFDPFFTTKEKGTGLGLAITYQIIRQNGGEIIVERTKDGFTLFSIVFPLNLEAKTKTKALDERKNKNYTPEGKING